MLPLARFLDLLKFPGTAFARQIGRNKASVSRYRSGGPAEAAAVVDIYVESGGVVEPNDLFDLPDLTRPLEAPRTRFCPGCRTEFETRDARRITCEACDPPDWDALLAASETDDAGPAEGEAA